MKPGSSPSIDGMLAEIFLALVDTPVPKMTQTVPRFVQKGSIPPGWALELLSPIPKESRLVSIHALRPICLQNVPFKWVLATVYVMIEDVVAFLTPQAKKPLLKDDSFLTIYGMRAVHGKACNKGNWLVRFFQGI